MLIESGDIQMVHGAEYLRQTAECVLGTNKGEWSLNIDEGINFTNILGKAKPIKKTAESKQLSEVSSLTKKLERRLDGENV